MIAFEAEVNGVRACLSGVGEAGVLTAVLSWVKTHEMTAESGEQAGKLELQIGGLQQGDGEPDAHVTWLDSELAVGDEIRIRIVNASEIDEPLRIDRRDPEKELKKKREYYERLKKEFED
jgi:hypothetical protein